MLDAALRMSKPILPRPVKKTAVGFVARSRIFCLSAAGRISRPLPTSARKSFHRCRFPRRHGCRIDTPTDSRHWRDRPYSRRRQNNYDYSLGDTILRMRCGISVMLQHYRSPPYRSLVVVVTLAYIVTSGYTYALPEQSPPSSRHMLGLYVSREAASKNSALRLHTGDARYRAHLCLLFAVDFDTCWADAWLCAAADVLPIYRREAQQKALVARRRRSPMPRR